MSVIALSIGMLFKIKPIFINKIAIRIPKNKAITIKEKALINAAIISARL